ncbi:MAG: 2TM domain-containing protein [Proteobacteria bacterium]|nr:2TM domain-containing protein [Pseudomonadota bacterium]
MKSTQNQNETSAHLRKREKFYKELTTYLICNLFFVAIWFFSGRGYFWPIWAMLGWGVAIGFSAAGFIRLSPKK